MTRSQAAFSANDNHSQTLPREFKQLSLPIHFHNHLLLRLHHSVSLPRILNHFLLSITSFTRSSQYPQLKLITQTHSNSLNILTSLHRTIIPYTTKILSHSELRHFLLLILLLSIEVATSVLSRNPFLSSVLKRKFDLKNKSLEITAIFLVVLLVLLKKKVSFQEGSILLRANILRRSGKLLKTQSCYSPNLLE